MWHRRNYTGEAGKQGPPNWNATNGKDVAKSLLFLQFQFLLASSSIIYTRVQK